MTNKTLQILLACIVSVIACHAEETNSIRVMSFNIRYGRANDGDNHWKHRQALVLKTIRRFDPDLLGTQETLKFQAEYLRENLKHLNYVGWSREQNSGGEQCGVLFRATRFELEESGQFWLSETPEKKFSRSWDSSLPRVATWVRLKDRRTDGLLLFVNTHFDHRGPTARLEAARLIREFVESQPADLPVVVTGDFNCAEASAPWQQLTSSARLSDTFRVFQPERGSTEGTFNGFTGRNTGGRIDWILVSRQWAVQAATIDEYSENGRYPSDHFPVTATIVRK